MADKHKKEETRLQPFDGGISTPAITGGELSNTLVGKKPSWFRDRVFGPDPAEPTEAERLAALREQRYSDMLRMKRNELQQQRTDATRMAQFNALGNVLTTMVQPLGWTAGGVTGGVQPYDDRQYLDAFNRAVKASDDLRNLGSLEAEYRFKVADEDYQRAIKEQDYQKRVDLDLEKQKQIFDMRSELSRQQMEERIKVAEATAKAKFQFSTRNGQKVTESVRDNLLKRANTAYAQILADYYKKKQVGIENLQEPPTYDEFLKQFASQNGYAVAESQNAKQPTATTASPAAPAAPAASSTPKPEKRGGFQTTSSAPASNSASNGKKGGFQM